MRCLSLDWSRQALKQWLDDRIATTSLAPLADRVQVTDVADVEILALNVRGEFTDASGWAVVGLRLEKSHEITYEAISMQFDFTLNSGQMIVEVRRIDADASPVSG